MNTVVSKLKPCGLAEACAAQTLAREELRRHRDEAAARETQLKNALSEASERVLLAGCGLDNAKIELARKVLYLAGEYKGSAPRQGVVRDAIDWLATREKRTYYAPDTGYFAAKNYSGFGDQREDHQYGFGPKHGSIVFAVGLREPKRPLTDEEREAALYYLVNIQAIEAARNTRAIELARGEGE